MSQAVVSQMFWVGRKQEMWFHTPIFAYSMILACLVECPNLLDGLVVENNNILAADILCSILLEKEQLISDCGETLQYLPFARVLRHRYRRSIHLEPLDAVASEDL